MSNEDKEAVLHFQCDSCGIHLGVDSSLAGQEAPCPKCGALIRAPHPDEKEAATMPPLTLPGGGGEDSENRLQRRERRRSGEYSERRSDPSETKVNYKRLFQIVLFVSVVALIALGVTWYLQHQ